MRTVDLDTVAEIVRPQDRAGLGKLSDGDAWLAGGSWLFSVPQPGLRRLIDLSTLGWPALETSADGLVMGATCTLAEVLAFRSPAEWAAHPLFGQCANALWGSFKIQAVATVGGNICLALPAGPMTALATALDGVATIWTVEGGERQCPVLDVVIGAGRTSLLPGELLRSVFLPTSALLARTAFRQGSLSSLGRSAALVIGRRSGAGTVLTVTASTTRPVQLRFPDLPAAPTVLTALDQADPVWHDDVHGHPRWRRHLTRTFLGEIVDELAEAA